mgnify:CR=1 FL=1
MTVKISKPVQPHPGSRSQNEQRQKNSEDRLRLENKVFYKKISFSQELKKQIAIRRLLDLGIQQYKGTSIFDLDYDTLCQALVFPSSEK